MASEIIAAPTELTDAELDAVGGGHAGHLHGIGGLVTAIIRDVDVTVDARGAQIAVLGQNQR